MRECMDKPGFASGEGVREATEHDIRALESHMPWVQLNYEDGATKPNRGWQSDLCSDRESDEDCDEYPFFSSEQGGPLAVPEPHLEAIDSGDNRAQGGQYSGFRRLCGLRTGTPQPNSNSVGGSPFLAIPIPPSLNIDTWYGCKTPASA
jgi:hypothetical protein